MRIRRRRLPGEQELCIRRGRGIRRRARREAELHDGKVVYEQLYIGDGKWRDRSFDFTFSHRSIQKMRGIFLNLQLYWSKKKRFRSFLRQARIMISTAMSNNQLSADRSPPVRAGEAGHFRTEDRWLPLFRLSETSHVGANQENRRGIGRVRIEFEGKSRTESEFRIENWR